MVPLLLTEKNPSDAYLSNETCSYDWAGDAYASGFYFSYNKKQNYPEAMCWGTANAGSVTQKIGAQRGLLNEKGVKKIINKYPKGYTKKILLLYEGKYQLGSKETGNISFYNRLSSCCR
jgi:hypothetical protein